MTLEQWAIKHSVSFQALHELRAMFGTGGPMEPLTPAQTGMSEAAIQQQIRIEASEAGCRLFRNNVGACKDETGRWVRFGLANESQKMNKLVKSADLIGIKPVTITPLHVGSVIGQFISREVKAGDWSYSGTPHELAQKAWADMINSMGGDARFVNKTGSFK